MRACFSVLLGLALAKTTSGCRCSEEQEVKQEVKVQPEASAAAVLPSPEAAPIELSREVVYWDFTSAPEPPSVSLWPDASPSAERDPQGVTLSAGANALTVQPSGPRPHIVWRFEPPVSAALFTAEFGSTRPGTLIASWTAPGCSPTDGCRAEMELGIDRRAFNVLLGQRSPVESFTLSMPATLAEGIEIFLMRFSSVPRAVQSAGTPNDSVVLTQSESGLEIASSTADPWVTLPVMGLDSASVESVELELLPGTDARPQLFWSGGACRHFHEECSLLLSPGPTPGSFHAKFSSAHNSTGRIEMLRLDPSESEGTFVVRRLSLIRAQGRK